MKQPLTAKLLNEKLKQGWVATDFAEHLEITVDQFWQTLQKQFTRNAYTGFKNSIHRNEKYQKRLSRNSHQSSDDTDLSSEKIIETVASTDLNSEEESNTSNDAALEVAAEHTATVSDNQSQERSEIISISELERTLSEKLELLNKIELEHKGLVSARLSVKNEIAEHKKALEEIRFKVDGHKAALSVLITRLDDTARTLTLVTSQRNLCRQEIDNLTSQIEAAKKVCIFVDNSGKLEWDSKLSFELPDWSTLFNDIVKEDELDSLTIKQIKALAQAIALTQFLKSIGANYEVYIENEISEKYFKKVIS